jgi:hypothetical protein
VIGSEAGLETAVRSRAGLVAREREALEERLKEVSKKRKDLKLERDRVVTWARKGTITEKELDIQLRAIQAEDEQDAADEDRLLGDLSLQGDAEAVYQQAQHLIPLMKDRMHRELTDGDKQELVRLLVRRALIDREGNMTIELKVPAPAGGFGCVPSRRGATHQPGG